ncbi:Myb/SANT-like DNA-binding domain protein [Medicago truncatula]|uniref:Myb/SANT-like DNA-binding domain protein n=1 Tax=Medicago truncatula TaxID=3880 RepID=G7KCQ9_MEDTR|nr:Myb/SANT-like DNA-binding domain protein [Medicago truncatula]
MSTSKRETWTTEMNNALIDAFVHQVSAGNKQGGTFTSIAYTNITKEMSEKFQRPFDKEKVKDRWKLVKRNFTKCHDIFNGMSGFAWKSDTYAKPEAAQWMNKPFANYDKLVIACGDERATGGKVMNDEDIRQNHPLNRESESIGTSDQVTLESLQEGGNEQDVTSPEVQIPPEPRAKRSRKSRDEDEVEGIKAALLNVADAFRESTASHDKYFKDSIAAYEKANLKLPISEEEVFKLLEELQVDSHMIIRAYSYLLEFPEKVRALLGLPKHLRKSFLLESMVGQGYSSR